MQLHFKFLQNPTYDLSARTLLESCTYKPMERRLLLAVPCLFLPQYLKFLFLSRLAQLFLGPRFGSLSKPTPFFPIGFTALFLRITRGLGGILLPRSPRSPFLSAKRRERRGAPPRPIFTFLTSYNPCFLTALHVQSLRFPAEVTMSFIKRPHDIRTTFERPVLGRQPLLTV